jgi:hypothetical protein
MESTSESVWFLYEVKEKSISIYTANLAQEIVRANSKHGEQPYRHTRKPSLVYEGY